MGHLRGSASMEESENSVLGDEETIKKDYKPLSCLSSNNERGGFRAASFMYVLVSLENMAFIAMMTSLYLYFNHELHFNIAGAANTLTNFLGATFILSMVGGFVSDTYITRFHTVLLFGLVEVLALVLMTIQARYKSLKPEDCGNKSSCMEGGIAVLFYTSLCLLALGSGGVRGALPALGADQFDQNDPKEAKALATYFNWLLLCTTCGATVGVTVIAWVSTDRGWWAGFLTCTLVTLAGFVVLAIGKSSFRIQVFGDSPMITVAQVIVVAIKNRKLTLPENADELYETSEKESLIVGQRIPHTNQFRCLDKAAIVPKAFEPSGWTVCTVTQVEEVKILTRMLPIIASTILMNTCMAQLQTVSVQQGFRMDRFIGKFEVPAISIPVIPLVFMSILIPIYEFLFVPFARKITKHPAGITQLQRVGIGLVLSIISMTIAGLVEVKRKNASLKNPLKPISVFWLSLQYGIFGIADMFTLVGLLEFFYKEAPASMKSLSTSFTWISLSFGYFLSSAFVDIINAVTKRLAPSKQGWLHGQNIDTNNLNLFYYFLAILSGLNFLIYLLSASWYKYKTEDSVPEPKFSEPKKMDVDDLPPPPKEESTDKDSTVELITGSKEKE
ncbi:protein NRT1/ PTR FAMILY 4.5-like [Cornus florida]|uniref:protein NRT1/ PTR FAMILY 4.5-like n=1 Tax=Cornus florida TaxID=4283 RepID=UPI00289E60E5|nr:protein NRT1/ PTR FAMILY 4.5-like [Cornus florida]